MCATRLTQEVAGGTFFGMTTATEAAAQPADRTALQLAGADLLQALIEHLSTIGYRKAAIDTWRHDGEAHNLRHSYRNGEWTITSWVDGGGAIEHRYSVRNTMPDLRTLTHAVLPPPF